MSRIVVVIAFASLALLSGCAERTILLMPSIPVLDASGAASPGVDVRVEMLGSSDPVPRIGKSESLGVHISDFYLGDSTVRLVQRLLESSLKAWGHRIVPGGERAELRAQVDQLTFNSRAINAFEFQADGVIEVTLEVVRKDARPGYRQRHVANCTWRSATSIPSKENMDPVFSGCVAELQKRISGDAALRAALSAAP